MSKKKEEKLEPKFKGKWKNQLMLKEWDADGKGNPSFERKYEVDPRENLFSPQTEKDRKKAYYYAHRDKIVAKKKAGEVKKAEEECETRGLPLMLAPYIRFYEETKYLKDPVGLKFDSIHELLIFLKDVRTKDEELSMEQLAELIHNFDHR